MATPPLNRTVWVEGTWALVLAGGDGSRLHSLTTTASGVVVPKQFCSLGYGPSLLTQSLIRAGSVAPVIQTCAVVVNRHKWWWDQPLRALPKENVFVQPENRGTAHGVLLALLRLEARDPCANVLMLPADHYIRQEFQFSRSLREVAELSARTEDAVFLLGADPDKADTDLGYIVPELRKSDKPTGVRSFVEKPDAARIVELLKAGALWNMFIIAGSVQALLALYDRSYRSSVALMRAAMDGKKSRGSDTPSLDEVYRQLAAADFSRDILEPQAQRLQVLGVPSCGWNDLGTPKRVIETLRTLPAEPRHVDAPPYSSAILSLADQYGRLAREHGSRLAL
ncbi:MAG TPA: sugar phosphate nucleotidyltransferase [Steroidobacteraceae bacterium]|nr:sugar phosphate nucleotidyltransferase [Steroidobacteraceae bacterium]